MTDYGPFAGLVASVGTLLAAGGAITIAWVRNASWAPPEDDVPHGPARIASLLTAIAVAGLWFETGRGLSARNLQIIAIYAGVATLIFLLLYTLMLGVYIYEKKIVDLHGQIETRRTVGGFWLTQQGKQSLAAAGTIQRLFEGAAYDPDLVWPRIARSLVKLVFIIAFTGLIVSGSTAISSIALSIDPSTSKGSDLPTSGKLEMGGEHLSSGTVSLRGVERPHARVQIAGKGIWEYSRGSAAGQAKFDIDVAGAAAPMTESIVLRFPSGNPNQRLDTDFSRSFQINIPERNRTPEQAIVVTARVSACQWLDRGNQLKDPPQNEVTKCFLDVKVSVDGEP